MYSSQGRATTLPPLEITVTCGQVCRGGNPSLSFIIIVSTICYKKCVQESPLRSQWRFLPIWQGPTGFLSFFALIFKNFDVIFS